MQNYERKLRKIKKAIKNLVIENSSLCDHIADIQNNIDKVKQEREFLLRKLIEHEPSTIDLIQQSNESKYKKRKNSSDASSVNKPHRPVGRPKTKKPDPAPTPPSERSLDRNIMFKQEIKQDDLTYFDDNATNYMISSSL
ncbi:CLUMA_CG014317, isoform A [Clunio marinus]|uniref:CLUMA_CG014317, isoform A n=1 Tax=Clunio marinus TaxID=568069 RepID=A0A1J1IMF4_9DIPT|nr:CLUMA_CG014317, isoform A [Clunio marinus]